MLKNLMLVGSALFALFGVAFAAYEKGHKDGRKSKEEMDADLEKMSGQMNALEEKIREVDPSRKPMKPVIVKA